MENSARTFLPQQLFQDVFDTSPIGIVLENLEGQLLFVNPAFCSMLGFSEEELRSKHCVDFSPPEDAEKDWALFQTLRAGEIDHYQLDKRYFRRDGSLLWGRLSISLLKAGPSPLIVAMVQDITSERMAEEKVRASEERLRLAQQAARMGSFETNVRTGVVTWTPEMESLYGLPAGGFDQTQAAFQNLIHPDDRARVTQLIDHARNTGEPTKGEWRVVWPDGSVHWIAGRWQVLMDEQGEPSRVFGVNNDVTERKHAEELLKIFVKNVPAGVAMLDRDMRYLQVSDRWCADYSVDSSQVLGRSHYEVFSDVPERWKEMHRRGLQGETLRADEDKWDRKGGTTTWVRWEIRPWTNSNGIIGGILILAEDITQRKQMEESLLSLSRRLIEAQEQERRWIARELHDDINQRIAMLAVDLDKFRQENPHSSVELQNCLEQFWERLTEISSEIQAISHRLHSSKLEYLGLVAACKGFCKEVAEHNKVIVDFTPDDIPSAVPRDVSLCLFRVLQESLNNGIKHSGARHFEVQLRGMSGDIQLTVRDHGIGFDAATAMLSRGLGLISMRERVSLVKGKLLISSKPMDGTEITVRIPIVAQSSSQTAVGAA